MPAEVIRKLTTILAADAEGYSRAMAADERRAFGALRTAKSVFAKFIELHHGRVANTAGDGLIAEFPSVVEAVQCAIDVQHELNGRRGVAGDTLRFRIGVHLGDVMVDGDDLLGDGVNLAARLQSMAEPDGILVSQQVYDQVHAKLSVGFDYLGEKRPKNFSQGVAVYRVASGRARTATIDATPTASGAGLRHPVDLSPRDAFDLRRRVLRHSRLFGIILAVLVLIDLTTGMPVWAHWPGIALATVLGMEAAPLFARSWLDVRAARSLVIAGALAVTNAASWSGEPWALWPAGALLAFEVARRLRNRSS